jgi:hypothetical protein
MSTDPPSPPVRFQFSVAALLGLMTVVALTLGVFGRGGQQYLLWAVMQVSISIVPAICLIGAVFARHHLQAFCLGALVPTLPMMISGTYGFNLSIGDPSWFWDAFRLWTVAHVNVLICGTVAVFAKRWIDRHPEGKLPFIDR